MTDEQGVEEDEGVEVDGVEAFAQLSPLIADLHANREVQSYATAVLMIHMAPIVPAMDQCRRFLSVTSGWVASKALASLMMRVSDDIKRGVFAVVSDDDAGANDVGRDLMEVEMLLLDFLRDAGQLDRWENLPARDRSDAFKYNKIADRVARSMGIEQGLVLPEAAEYTAHSAGLHPTPSGRVMPALDVDLETRIALMTVDLFEHVDRCMKYLTALLDGGELFNDDEIDPEGVPDLSLSMVEPAQELVRSHQEMLMETLRDSGVEIKERGPFSRRESPDGFYRFTRPAPPE